MPFERVKIHNAPRLAASAPPCTAAVLPSADNATDQPCIASPTAPVPISFGPCCVQIPPDRVKIQLAPTLSSSNAPPRMAVLPSEDKASDQPKQDCPAPSLLTSFACWIQELPERVKTQAAPMKLLSGWPPTRAVLPSKDNATRKPCVALPIAPVPISLACCVQVFPERVNTQAAPTPPLSPSPPTIAVFPSPDNATWMP